MSVNNLHFWNKKIFLTCEIDKYNILIPNKIKNIDYFEVSFMTDDDINNLFLYDGILSDSDNWYNNKYIKNLLYFHILFIKNKKNLNLNFDRLEKINVKEMIINLRHVLNIIRNNYE